MSAPSPGSDPMLLGRVACAALTHVADGMIFGLGTDRAAESTGVDMAARASSTAGCSCPLLHAALAHCVRHALCALDARGVRTREPDL